MRKKHVLFGEAIYYKQAVLNLQMAKAKTGMLL